MRGLSWVALICCSAVCLYGQASTQSSSSFDFNSDGIVFQTADSANRVIMRFRMQNWVHYVSKSETDLSAASIDWVVRRLRLRFGGHLFDPRLTFNLQLSFSRSDQDYSDTQFPNIVRDAMVFWNFSKDLQVGFGQTKLPGNRQRVISSADLEFPDRSIVNGAFNLDRDFGLQGFWRPITGDFQVILRGALSEGRGRNQLPSSGGELAYTGRIEVLPLGAFTKGGDYFEGDLLREQTPKLSLALSAQQNNNMMRTRGELGKDLFTRTTAATIYADALLKYSGLSVYGEYAMRTSDNPITYNADSSQTRSVLVGNGWLAQATYTFPFMMAVGARYGVVDADEQLAGQPEYVKDEALSGVITYFINKHRIKTNLEIGMNTRTDHNRNDLRTSNFFARYNIELGI